LIGSRQSDGGWILTYSSRHFYPLDPRPADVDIDDIAHALSLTCRYNGHTSVFYSVAEHSLLLCQEVTRRRPDDLVQQLQALLHDAAEAYLCDIPRPVKPLLSGYYEAEARVDRAISEHFGIEIAPKTALIAELDTRILCDETAALMPPESAEWHQRLGMMLGVEIRALGPGQAEREFLMAFDERYSRLFAPRGKPIQQEVERC
jgi:hypothetical protein